MSCLTPFNVRIQNRGESATSYGRTETIPVPCGKCPDCVGKRVSQWSFRLRQELKTCRSAYFVTLTYAPSHLPLSPLGLMSLRKCDFQNFMKRLRERERQQKNTSRLKYYAVGEYGTKHSRPHFHAVLLNADMQSIEYSWQLGDVWYGTVEAGAVAYMMKYLSKERKIGVMEGDDRVPEFALMSKGIGLNYLTDEIVKYHLKDPANRLYLTVNDYRVSMPRYYKNKIFSEMNFASKTEADAVKKIAGLYALRRMENQMAKYLAKQKPTYSRDKVERDIAEWKAMNIDGYADKNIF